MASILKVDEMQGVTSAGDITITSEGGSATQSLQQGVAKGWVNFNGSGTLAVRDSLNSASVTDGGTGNFTPNFTNAFSSTNYIGLGANEGENNHSRGMKGIGVGVDGSSDINNQTTTALQMFSNYGSTSTSNGGADDTKVGFVAYLGDLA